MIRLSYILILGALQILLAVTGLTTHVGSGMDGVCRAASSAAGYTGEQNERYSATNPLVYEDSWEKWPFSYRSDEGKPRGFNIELMTKIMHRLKIPYEVRLRNQQHTRQDIATDSADVTFVITRQKTLSFAKLGKVEIYSDSFGILMPREFAVERMSEAQLCHEDVYITQNSGGLNTYMKEIGMADSLIHYVLNMESEILREAEQGIGGAVWSLKRMNWVIKKYHLEDRYVAVPIPREPSRCYFASGDTALLARLDSVCLGMKKSGEIQQLYDKWFTPGDKQQSSNYTQGLLIALAIVAFAIFMFIVGKRYIKRHSRNTLQDIRRRMRLVFRSNGQKVWVYYPEAHRYAWMTSDGQLGQLYTSYDFSHFYPKGDFDILHQHVLALAEGKEKGQVKETIRCQSLTEKDKVLDVEVTMRELYDEYGKIYLVCGLQYDISGSKAVLDHMRVLQESYTTAFSMARGTVMRFDENKRMVAINEIGCDRLGISNLEAFLAEGYYMKDVDLLEDVDVDDAPMELRFTHIVNGYDMRKIKYINSRYFNRKSYALHGYYDSRIAGDDNNINKHCGYYDIHLIKTLDEKGKAISYLLFINNRTNEIRGQRRLVHMQQQITRLREDNAAMRQRRNYTLQVADIWMVKYDPDRKVLIVRDHNTKRPPFSQVTLLEMVDPTCVKRVFNVFRKLDSRVRGDVAIDIKTYIRNDRGEQRYFRFDFRPSYNNNGAVTSYFGTCRDITTEIYAEKKLLNETHIVEEAERLKSDFLKNTSFSLRQPLINMSQSIAHLRNGVSNEVQNDIIANITANTRRLIKLSDDTLLLSRIEAGMLTLHRNATDFVKLFTQTVEETMAEYSTANITHSIESTYKELMLNVDAVHLRRVIHEAIGLAARYVCVGHITMHYMYVKNVLTVVVQDNGQGIPPNVLAHIFEPHMSEDVNVSNNSVFLSGLEMPICKALLELTNSSIDIDSDPGRGTSIYITIGVQAVDNSGNAIGDEEELMEERQIVNNI